MREILGDLLYNFVVKITVAWGNQSELEDISDDKKSTGYSQLCTMFL